MKSTVVVSTILAAAATMASASAVPQTRDLHTTPVNVTENCINPTLCCGTLTTPVDGLVDGLLGLLGINGAELVGSVGLLCSPYDDTCTQEPSCCTEANVLNGVLALGCTRYSD